MRNRFFVRYYYITLEVSRKLNSNTKTGTLRKSNSEQETQTQLFELLGALGVETMITIMSKADLIRKRVKKFDVRGVGPSTVSLSIECFHFF